jgi:c(7)-type cytochrome triheme protein
MRTQLLWILVAVSISVCGIAYGAAMQDIIYKGDKASDEVIFHGDQHLKRGFKCNDCHNKEMFPEKKKGATVITMKAIQQGKLCGKCHNGKIAFGIDHHCDRCHPKKGPDTLIYD